MDLKDNDINTDMKNIIIKEDIIKKEKNIFDEYFSREHKYDYNKDKLNKDKLNKIKEKNSLINEQKNNNEMIEKLVEKYFNPKCNINEKTLYYHQILLWNARGIYKSDKIELLKRKIMEYNISIAFIIDIKNEIKIDNYEEYFDGQNEILWKKDIEWTWKKNYEKIEINNQINKIHNGWKNGKRIFTYIKPLDNNYMKKLLKKMERDKEMVILGDLNLNSNEYWNNYSNKHQEIMFIGEKNQVGILINKDYNKKEKYTLKQRLLSNSDHEIIIIGINEEIKMDTIYIIDKFHAKKNTIKILDQLLLNEKVNYTKIFKEINISRNIKRTLENKNLMQMEKIRIRNILLCTYKIPDWRYITETFRIKKREEFYGTNINENMVKELIYQTEGYEINKIGCEMEMMNQLEINYIDNLLMETNKYLLLIDEQKMQTNYDKIIIYNGKLNLKEKLKHYEKQYIIKYRINNMKGVNSLWPGRGESGAPDFNGIIFSSLMKSLRRSFRNSNSLYNNRLLDTMRRIFKRMLESNKLKNVFMAFYLKKKDIVEKLDDVRVLWIAPLTIKFYEAIYYEIILSEITYYVNRQKKWQFGFVCNGDCKNAVNQVQKIGLKNENIIIFLDLKRAFDSVNHEILEKSIENDMEIKNMRTYNILKIWLKLLKGAYMYTNNIRWRFKRGLPMGLKFSPIVFDLYFYYSIKDLIEIPDTIVAFADDTTIVINENISFNYFLQLKQNLNNFRIEINYHKSEILTVYNNDLRSNVSKFRNLGFKIMKNVKLLGKMIKYNGDKSLIQDRKQLEDLIKFKINKLFKIPLKLQVQMLNSFYVSRIRYMFIISMYYERRSRIEFTNELMKSFSRLTYIKLEEEEKDIVLVQLNLVKLILLVLNDDDIIKLMRSNIEEKMEVIKIIYELLYETFYIKENNFMEKMKNIFMELNKFDDIKLFKKYIKFNITKKINLHIMEEYKKLVNIEIDKIYRKEIIIHRIFWLIIKDFNTIEKNKVIYGMNIIKIKIILE